ncbi:MAG TPA: HAD hydrolase family protein [Luteibaculaceae bacterium]|nr:HAD hydrolase family protein [Luteibaculaceae bacterium]
MPSYKELLPSVKALIFDVDGVFTDNTVYLHPSGDLLRSMNTKDGYAVRLAIEKGLFVGVISGGRSESVKDRLLTLGVHEVHLGVFDKLPVLKAMVEKNNLKWSECLYMGDDIPDYEVMRSVGVAVAPADAAPEIKSICHYVSPLEGGKGCVRDVVEQTLKSQQLWFDLFVPST